MGFRVSGLGFEVQSCRVERVVPVLTVAHYDHHTVLVWVSSSGFRVERCGCRVESLRFMVLVLGFQFSGFGSPVSGSGSVFTLANSARQSAARRHTLNTASPSSPFT